MALASTTHTDTRGAATAAPAPRNDTLIDFASLRRVAAAQTPFFHLVARNLLTREAIDALVETFPKLPVSGLLPAQVLRLSPRLSQLAEELRGPLMGSILGEKFQIDLRDRPTMLTVRSQAAARDGRIHTDSESKIVTALLYLNPGWSAAGGRLRLLRAGTDIADYFAEVAPEAGTLVAFRRSELSWHGHLPFVGTRRYLMINWMADASAAVRETTRHRVAAALKGIFT
jgi:hypothetical protein